MAKLVLDVIGKEALTVWASVELGKKPGVALSDEPPPPPPVLYAGPIYLAHPPARSVRSSSLPEVENRQKIGENEPLGLIIAFEANVRIGNFGFEGPIKPIVDRCAPLLGTYHNGVADYRIHEIRIYQGQQPEKSGATIGFWFLPS